MGEKAEAGRLVRRRPERVQTREAGGSLGHMQGEEGVMCDPSKRAVHSLLILPPRGAV